MFQLNETEDYTRNLNQIMIKNKIKMLPLQCPLSVAREIAASKPYHEGSKR